MAEARLRAAGGQIDTSILAARAALQLDRHWPMPIFFLADQALECGQHAQATALLDSIVADHGGNKQFSLRRSAYHAVAANRLATEVALAWLALVDSPPTTRVIGEMDELAGAHPELAFMREAVRWARLRSGNGDHVDEACPTAGSDPSEVENDQHAPSAFFAGDLRLFPVPNLLEFLRAGYCSGVLICHGPLSAVGIQLVSGRIAGVIAPSRANLGAALMAAGLVTASEAERAKSELPGGVSDRRIAQYILSTTNLEAAVIRNYMLRQIYGLLRQMIGWTGGHFSFDPEVPYEAIDERLEIDLDPQSVLLSACAELDEAAG
jgi:hypothetical protein